MEPAQCQEKREAKLCQYLNESYLKLEVLSSIQSC